MKRLQRSEQQHLVWRVVARFGNAPPLRLPLGSDAVQLIEQADRTKLDELRRWRELSMSTDFPEQLAE